VSSCLKVIRTQMYCTTMFLQKCCE